MIGGVAPKLVDLTDAVLFGDVWERPGLSRRDRSLVAVLLVIRVLDPLRCPEPTLTNGSHEP
jgi:4-carboxymuconolactone decarboxylase